MDTNNSAVKAGGRGEERVNGGEGKTCNTFYNKEKFKNTQKNSIHEDVCFVFKRSQPPNLDYLKKKITTNKSNGFHTIFLDSIYFLLSES